MTYGITTDRICFVILLFYPTLPPPPFPSLSAGSESLAAESNALQAGSKAVQAGSQLALIPPSWLKENYCIRPCLSHGPGRCDLASCTFGKPIRNSIGRKLWPYSRLTDEPFAERSFADESINRSDWYNQSSVQGISWDW